MPAASDERKQFLHDIFVTAMEGGIDYWSERVAYYWLSGDGTDDLDNFYAHILDIDNEAHRIDAKTISKGLLIAREPENVGREMARLVREAEREYDAGEIDAEVADVIVQLGLFGEVVYG